jgi:hypothetical protein
VSMQTDEDVTLLSMKHNHRELLASPPVSPEAISRAPHWVYCWPAMIGGDLLELELNRSASLVVVLTEHINAVACRWRWLRPLRDRLYPPGYWAEAFTDVPLSELDL